MPSHIPGVARVSGWVPMAHSSWREAARIVGDCVAVGVRPDVVLGVVAHGVELLRS